MENSKLKLILASGSPRRKELLSHLHLPFEKLSLDIPEDCDKGDPETYCAELSKRKGKAVAEKVRRERNGNFLIVSADTIVALRGKIYNKPVNVDEARVFLNELSGQTHSVFTAVTMNLTNEKGIFEHTFVDESQVSFDPIPSDIMELYLATGDSLDKAGAYGIQGPSLTFISKVEGSYSNVVGFPLSRFVKEANSFLGQYYPDVKSWLKLF
jgi:septum formation protein